MSHRNGSANGAIQSLTAERWAARADELVDWTWKRAVNRTDAFGRYYQRNGAVEITTDKHGLTKEILAQHFRARGIADIVGLHTTSFEPIEGMTGGGVSQSGWLCAEIDNHTDGDAPEVNERAAVAWYDVLVGLGFHPLLSDSNGRGGFHLRVMFDERIATFYVRQLGRWLTRDWKERGLPEPPEVFPKQPEIKAPGSQTERMEIGSDCWGGITSAITGHECGTGRNGSRATRRLMQSWT